MAVFASKPSFVSFRFAIILTNYHTYAFALGGPLLNSEGLVAFLENVLSLSLEHLLVDVIGELSQRFVVLRILNCGREFALVVV